MKLTEFESKRIDLGIDGSGITSTVTKDRVWSDKVTKEPTFTIPSGATVQIYFSPKKYPNRFFTVFGEDVKICMTTQGYRWLKGFRKPLLSTL